MTWHRIPLPPLPTQIFRDLWFSVLSSLYLTFRSRPEFRGSPVVAIGTSSFGADIRIIQFLHASFYQLIKRGVVSTPNPRSVFHRLYQIGYSWTQGRLEAWLLPKSKTLIAISSSVANDLKGFLPEPQRPPIVNIPHAPDQIPAKPQRESKLLKPPQPVILFVGALERKGIAKALRILAGLSHRNWRFWAVGAGDLERWRNEANRLGIADYVEFFGARPSEEFFRLADIFLFPSSYEPFGLVVTEAISHGLATLASNDCGALDLWPDRPSWLNLAYQDSDLSWQQALQRILDDPNERSTMIVSAKDSVSSWSWDRASELYEQVFLQGASGESTTITD